MSSITQYNQKKKRLLRDLKLAIQQGQPIALKKKTSNLFRTRAQGKVARLDVSDMTGVIGVDAKHKTAEVEGMATYETILAETLKHGLMPAVVPQLKTITLGGAVTGIGIESSSFKYGFPHETVVAMDILTGDGRVVEAKPTGQHKDLFYGFPNSYGSLGYALKLTIKLVSVKKYVKLSHVRYKDMTRYFGDLQAVCDTGLWQGKNTDFVDGMIYQKREYYLVLGQMTDTAPYVSSYTYKNIYYKSIRDRDEDYLTISDYIWRWDTDWFWCSQNMGAENPIIRRLYGKKRLRSDVFMKLLNFEMKHKYKQKLDVLFRRPATEMVIQDVEIPVESCQQFLQYYLQTIPILPVWVCPVRQYDPKIDWSLYTIDAEKLYINFGFWSGVPQKGIDATWHNTSLEAKVTSLDGKKSLYSDAYYDEKTFWQLYNRSQYDILKKMYDSKGAFKNLYEKTVKRG